MEAEKKGGDGCWALWCVLAAMAAIIIYPLSIGPALWLTSSHGSIDPALNRIYGPALWLISKTDAQPEYVVYLRWWVPDAFHPFD
jgi:hypothetical protein